MTPQDLGTLEIQPDPTAAEALRRRQEDHRELMRIAARSAMANGGRHLDGESLAIAKRRAASPPLTRPLGTGEPTA